MGEDYTRGEHPSLTAGMLYVGAWTRRGWMEIFNSDLLPMQMALLLFPELLWDGPAASRGMGHLMAVPARQFLFGDTQRTGISPCCVRSGLRPHAVETKLNFPDFPGKGQLWSYACPAGTKPAQAVTSLLSELLDALQFSWEGIYSKEVGEANWN